MLALLLTPYTVQAKKVEPPTKSCLDSLTWQRWNYTKAHYDVQQTIRESGTKSGHWRKPNSNTACLQAISTSKRLRVGESSHWNRLRLSRSGVKWIIRRQFRSQGRAVVLNAWQIASCESNFHWYSRSSTGDAGVWQINQVHNEPDSVRLSPEKSTAWAWRASSHGHNFSPTWVCATHYGID